MDGYPQSKPAPGKMKSSFLASANAPAFRLHGLPYSLLSRCAPNQRPRPPALLISWLESPISTQEKIRGSTPSGALSSRENTTRPPIVLSWWSIVHARSARERAGRIGGKKRGFLLDLSRLGAIHRFSRNPRRWVSRNVGDPRRRLARGVGFILSSLRRAGLSYDNRRPSLEPSSRSARAT